MANEETVEGYLVDIACLRRYPSEQVLVRAREHTVACARMGHCVESGYGIVDDRGQVHLLDASATPRVLEKLDDAREQGARLRVQRREDEGDMETQAVETVN